MAKKSRYRGYLVGTMYITEEIQKKKEVLSKESVIERLKALKNREEGRKNLWQ